MQQGALDKNTQNNLPHVAVSLARSSPGPRVSIPVSASPNPRILNNLGRLLRSISDGNVEMPSPRSTASSCAWFRPSRHCRKPAKWRAWLQLRNQMLERAGEDGSVVVSWGASRAHSLSNRPFPQITRPVPGVSPAGLRYSALGTVHRTLAMLNPRLQGRVCSARQDRVTDAAALTSKGARIVSITVSHCISNRTVSISTIRPPMRRAVRRKAELRCLHADNRPGSFHTPRYCLDLHQYQVYTAVTSKPSI